MAISGGGFTNFDVGDIVLFEKRYDGTVKARITKVWDNLYGIVWPEYDGCPEVPGFDGVIIDDGRPIWGRLDRCRKVE